MVPETVMPRRAYPSDLTDAQWGRLEPLLPPLRSGGRPRTHSPREIIDAIRYVLCGGMSWRALPRDFPPWQTVYYYFRAWRVDGTWERLDDELRDLPRERAARRPEPSRVVCAGDLNARDAGCKPPR
jgi:putative transposase